MKQKEQTKARPETEQADIKTQFRVISCRPDELLRDKFLNALSRLGAEFRSELARRAMAIGLEKAAKDIAEEKRKAARETLKQLRSGVSLTSSSPCGCVESWHSPFLSPVN